MASFPDGSRADAEHPLDGFSQCHAGIAAQLQELAQLPALAAAAQQARAVAGATLSLFRDAVMEHHADEEKELFPAVLRSARPGEEAGQVAAMVERLGAEHRAIEALWKRLEPSVRAAAKGADATMDAALAAQLVDAYLGHARFEEQHFLPLAARILGRDGNHMAALGLSLHMRHVPHTPGYI